MSGISIHKATVADASEIATIYQDRPPTVIGRLSHGTVESATFHDALESMFVESLQDPDEVLFVARDPAADGKVVSYVNLARKEAIVPMTEEQVVATRDTYKARLRPGMNGPLLMEMWEKLDRTNERVLTGRGPYWMVDNVGTLQAYQGRGIATRLLKVALAEVSVGKEVPWPVSLDTSGDVDGRAWPLYERLGFVRAADFEIDLKKFGGKGLHRHLVMVKEPSKSD